jgi:hypothetical protein
MTSKGRKK